MNNEWHENIPPQGILCRDDDGFVVLITEVVGIFGFNGLKYGYPLSKLTPLHCDSQRNGYKKWLPLPKEG